MLGLTTHNRTDELDSYKMSAPIPPSIPHRKPGIPAPRLSIPPRDSPSTSRSSSSTGGSGDGEDFESGQSAGTSHSSSSVFAANTHMQSSSHSQPATHKPKLSLFGVGSGSNSRPSTTGHAVESTPAYYGSAGASTSYAAHHQHRDDITVAPGFEHMSLEDKTMKPGIINSVQYQQPAPSKTKPKLALGAVARTPSPMPNLSLDTRASTSSSGSSGHGHPHSSGVTSESLTRSTSFEGALIAETSQVSVNGDDYKLSPEVLQMMGRLGEGASGEVFKVLHKPSGLIMAKKTIPASPNEDVQKQILRELAFNRKSRSDYITRYYGAFLEDSDSQIAICMEYCEGGSLDAIYKRIKERQGRTGEKVLGKVAESVLHGLVYLHDRKIIHRDIKPSNILVTRNGQFKLSDFGISGELINSMAGTFCGTSYYMAPERIRGARYTITSDIWSLGLTIHEVAMNRFPFPPEGEPPLGPIELLTYIVAMDTPALTDNVEQGVKWTKAIQDFVRLCLEKDPAKRPSPTQLLQHPWIKKSENWHPDLEAWVSQVWEW